MAYAEGDITRAVDAVRRSRDRQAATSLDVGSPPIAGPDVLAPQLL